MGAESCGSLVFNGFDEKMAELPKEITLGMLGFFIETRGLFEGINLPEGAVRQGINSYKLHTNYGTVSSRRLHWTKRWPLPTGGRAQGIHQHGQSFERRRSPLNDRITSSQ